MGVGLEFKVPRAIFKMALLMALFLTIASGSQEPCDDVNQTCEQPWNLRTVVDDGSPLAYDSNGDNLVADLSAFSTDTVAFDYLNQSSSVVVQRVVTGNDTAKFIKLTANDVNNDLLSYTIVSLPSHGNISGTGPNIIYVPDQGYVGNDSIVIGANDETGYLQNITVSIDVLLFYHPPSVRIRSPQNREIFTAYAGDDVAEVPIHATASGDVVDEIQFYDGLYPLEFVPCEDGGSSCAATLLWPFEVGTHTIIAKATDSSGKTCTSLPVVITVNPSEPFVELSSPVDGQIFTSPSDITITAEVTDRNPISYVEFFANSKSLARIEDESPYTFVWTDAKPGVYNLVAMATDEMGTAMSKPVLVIVVPVKALSKSDLALTMASSPNPAPTDGFLNYLLTVTNRGPDSATDVTVEDFLPPEMTCVSSKASQGFYHDEGIWDLGGLTKYRSAKLVLTVQTPSEAAPGQIANTAYVYGAELDPDNSNNHAITYTKIRASAAPIVEQNSTEINSTEV
ncbi:MAG: Ig-like domain-containing protein [Methanothrix sp.]